MINYQVTTYEGEYALWSFVATNFGGYARNYICSGTKEYCEQIKTDLEAKENNESI